MLKRLIILVFVFFLGWSWTCSFAKAAQRRPAHLQMPLNTVTDYVKWNTTVSIRHYLVYSIWPDGTWPNAGNFNTVLTQAMYSKYVPQAHKLALQMADQYKRANPQAMEIPQIVQENIAQQVCSQLKPQMDEDKRKLSNGTGTFDQIFKSGEKSKSRI